MFARLFIVLIALSLTACGAPYVNIPPLKGDSPAGHNPNGSTVITVEAAALERVISQDAPPDGYVVELPDGSLPETYAAVLDRLPVGSRTPGDTQQVLPHYTVAQVQVRGFSAQVDVIRPADAEGKQELVSVYLSVDMDGWYAKQTRVWRIPVDQALALARTAPPQAEEADDEPAEQTTDEAE